MFASIKGWVIGLAVVAVLALGWGYGRHEYTAGAQSVQVQWDAAKQSAGAVQLARADNVITGDTAQARTLVDIDSTYQTRYANAAAIGQSESVHSVLAGVGSLRPIWQCQSQGAVGGGHSGKPAVPASAAGAGRPHGAQPGPAQHGAEIAATAVLAGDAADTRERQLGAKVEALQAVVREYEARDHPAPASSAPVPR